MALALAVVSSLTTLGVAWIGLRQERVRRELHRVNGAVSEKLEAIDAKLPPADSSPPTS